MSVADLQLQHDVLLPLHRVGELDFLRDGPLGVRRDGGARRRQHLQLQILRNCRLED